MDHPPEQYQLTFEPREKYLYVHIQAEVATRDIALAYLTEVAQKCKELDYRRLLIERDVPMMMSEPDIFLTTNDFLNMIRGVTVAFVNPHASHEGSMRFAMLVGTNRGARFKAFTEFVAAEDWLTQRVRAKTD